jgi:hypothetical protein
MNMKAPAGKERGTRPGLEAQQQERVASKREYPTHLYNNKEIVLSVKQLLLIKL